jgi:hypothetical protein
MREGLLRPLKWLETKEGTQDDTEIIKDQRRNPR